MDGLIAYALAKKAGSAQIGDITGTSYKGTVDTYSDLPNDATAGDSYSVTTGDASHAAGLYSYSGSAWSAVFGGSGGGGSNLTHETWTFTLADGTTTTKEVVLWT